MFDRKKLTKIKRSRNYWRIGKKSFFITRDFLISRISDILMSLRNLLKVLLAANSHLFDLEERKVLIQQL